MTGRRDAFLRLSRDDAELDRLLVHDSLEAFFQGQERRVDRVFERKVVVIPAEKSATSGYAPTSSGHAVLDTRRRVHTEGESRAIKARNRLTASRGTSLR